MSAFINWRNFEMKHTLVNKYQTLDDKNYYRISMFNKNGVQVDILNYGATLEHFFVPGRTSEKDNIILSLERPEYYDKERNYLGGTVGRVIGRIAHGHWQDEDNTIQFELNDGPNHAHGGSKGFDTQVFGFTIKENENCSILKLHLLDPDNYNNYPGNLSIYVTYTLTNENTLIYEIEAISDKKTLCNPANHSYFNLNSGKDILDQYLTLDADYYLPLDKNSIPTGEQKSVTNTPFDFRKPKLLGKAITSLDPQIREQLGLNHPFLLNRNNNIAAVLESLDHQRRLSVETTAPSIVVYTGNHFNNSGFAQNIGQYGGVALETQFPPSNDESLSSIVLLPYQKFYSRTSWCIEF